MEKINKWDIRFMNLAQYVAEWSKDSRKVGCVIVNDKNDIISMGYNGTPRGSDDQYNQRRYEKPDKYLWIEHSERNAIFNAGRLGIPLFNSKMYVTYFPCVECSRAIVQSGVKKLYTNKPDLNHPKWGDSWVESVIMLKECGVEVIWTNED